MANLALTLALAVRLSCGAIVNESTPLAVVPGYMLSSLQAKLNSSWTFAALESARPEEFEKAVAIVPSFNMEKNTTLLHSVLAQAPQGKLLQIAMTGFEWLNISTIPARYTVCNVHNSDVAIPEYVLAAVLSWNIRLPQLDADFKRCTWQATTNNCVRPGSHTQTKGQTMGIIGYGHLGSGVAMRAAALGMRVIAVTLDPPSTPPSPLAWVGDDSELPRLMQESDFVVITVPLLPSTIGLVSSAMLGHMKSSGVLINVARGPIVDEAGLYDSLDHRRIGGAVLDVWWQSMKWMSPGQGGPSAWPSKFNFSALPNVWMTPHISYDTEESTQEAVVQVAANLQALASGHVLQNVVRNASSPVEISAMSI